MFICSLEILNPTIFLLSNSVTTQSHINSEPTSMSFIYYEFQSLSFEKQSQGLYFWIQSLINMGFFLNKSRWCFRLVLNEKPLKM